VGIAYVDGEEQFLFFEDVNVFAKVLCPPNDNARIHIHIHTYKKNRMTHIHTTQNPHNSELNTILNSILTTQYSLFYVLESVDVSVSIQQALHKKGGEAVRRPPGRVLGTQRYVSLI
jgi:hypothetical protein